MPDEPEIEQGNGGADADNDVHSLSPRSLRHGWLVGLQGLPTPGIARPRLPVKGLVFGRLLQLSARVAVWIGLVMRLDVVPIRAE